MTKTRKLNLEVTEETYRALYRCGSTPELGLNPTTPEVLAAGILERWTMARDTEAQRRNGLAVVAGERRAGGGVAPARSKYNASGRA